MKKQFWIAPVMGLLLVLMSAIVVLANDGTTVDWWVVAGGGAPSSADSITMNGTLGQPVAGTVGEELKLCSGFYCSTDASPTAVLLASFTGTAQEQFVLLEWETGSEIENLGFNLYRAVSPEDTPEQLNAELIPGKNPGSVFGASYYWLDEIVEPGGAYFYWLEAVSTNGGTRRFGPVSIASGVTTDTQVYLPVVER